MKSDSAVDMLLVARVKVVACVCDERMVRKRIEKSILWSIFNLDLLKVTVTYTHS